LEVLVMLSQVILFQRDATPTAVELTMDVLITGGQMVVET
jgi:hypothetical protein